MTRPTGLPVSHAPPQVPSGLDTVICNKELEENFQAEEWGKDLQPQCQANEDRWVGWG